MGNHTSKTELRAEYHFVDNIFRVGIFEASRKNNNLSKFFEFLEKCRTSRFNRCKFVFFGSPRFHRFTFVPEVCSKLKVLILSNMANSSLSNLLCKVLMSSGVVLRSLFLVGFFNPAILQVDTSRLKNLQLVGSIFPVDSDVF